MRVVVPRAFSGSAAAYISAFRARSARRWSSRSPRACSRTFTFNPTQPAATITAYIVQVSLGDLPHGSIGYQTIFVTGLVLF